MTWTEISGGPFVVATILKVVVFFTLLILIVALGTVVERKVAAFIQDRSGPNRVGPWGCSRSSADGLKNLLKEETMARSAASRRFFLLAPGARDDPGHDPLRGHPVRLAGSDAAGGSSR